MDPTISTLIIGSAIGLLVSLITTWFSTLLAYSREKRAEKRKHVIERIDKLEAFYEDLLQDMLHRNLIVLTDAASVSEILDSVSIEKAYTLYSAKLDLLSTAEIGDLYDEASIANLEMLRDLTKLKEKGVDIDRDTEVIMKIYKRNLNVTSELTRLIKGHLSVLRKQSE